MKCNFFRLSGFFLLTFLSLTFSSIGQNKNPNALKGDNTIIIQVSDSTKDLAKTRFIKYLKTNGITVLNTKTITLTDTTPSNNKRTISIINTVDNYKPMLLHNSPYTISTSRVKFINVMLGEYEAVLEFIITTDKSLNVSIEVTGHLTIHSNGFNAANVRMQNGGKDSMWTQKDLFKKVDNLVKDYNDVEKISYNKN